MMKLFIAIMAVVACQGEEGSEVLVRAPQQETKPALPAPPSFYGDVTTTGDRRFVFKITYNSDETPAKILFREIKPNGDTFSDDTDCIDKLDNPILDDDDKDYYEITAKKTSFEITIRQPKKGKRSNQLSAFAFDQKYNGKWLKYVHHKGTKKNTASHEVKNTDQFDNDYFPEDARFCEDESPSATKTKSP